MRDLTNRQRENLYNWGSVSLSDTKDCLSKNRSMTVNDAYRDEIDTVLEHIEYRETEPGSKYEQFFYHFRIDMEMQLALEKIRKAVRRQRRAARREQK
jgi:hypothetical protein